MEFELGFSIRLRTLASAAYRFGMSSPGVPAPLPQGAGSASAPPRPRRLAERDGREAALEVAIARGVGLVSVGAPAALRAFMVNMLDTARPGQFVFAAPKIDLIDLLELRGEGSAQQLPLLPAGLVVTESFDEAVDLLEREALTRALAPSDGQDG